MENGDSERNKREKGRLIDEMRVESREIAPSLQLNNWILSREKGASLLVISRARLDKRRIASSIDIPFGSRDNTAKAEESHAKFSGIINLTFRFLPFGKRA